MTLYIIGMSEKVFGNNSIVINTTSNSRTWSRELSPFLVGPCKLYGGFESVNVENGWQFSKLYKPYIGPDGNPKSEYWIWAKQGWDDSYGHRYPMGKGAKPEYSLWDGQKLGYIDARKQIYIPLYSEAVKKSDAYKILQETYKQVQIDKKDLYLRDYDAYDFKNIGWTYEQVINCPTKIMGHAFILGMLLENYI
jgi:hypothetical protein